MRYAVLSDIHGNLPALEAVIEHARRENVDGVLVAGDLYAGVPFSREVLDLLDETGAVCIAGNGEGYLLDVYRGTCPPAMLRGRQWRMVRWSIEALTGGMQLVARLPQQMVIHPDGLPRLRMVHGSLRRVNEGLVPDQQPDVLAEFRRAELWPAGQDPPSLQDSLAGLAESVLICGHVHIPWQQRVAGRLVLNPGSVGMSNNGDPRAQYAVLYWTSDGWQAQHKQVDYDRWRAVDAYAATDLLETAGGFARSCVANLLTGQNTVWFFVQHAMNIARSRGEDYGPGFSEAVMTLAEQTFHWSAYGV